jgi:molybdopterin-guanine dinucleotide biosynthesis protein B
MTASETNPPRPTIITVVGFSDAGKTTVIEKLLPELKRRGLKVGTIKHAHHGFTIDREGKDSWRHQQAGADMVAVAGPAKTAVMINTPLERLADIRPFMTGVDVIIAEGFKSERMPKVEVLRSAVHANPLFLEDPDLFALVTDIDLAPRAVDPVAVFGLDDIAALADLIVARFLARPSAS